MKRIVFSVTALFVLSMSTIYGKGKNHVPAIEKDNRSKIIKIRPKLFAKPGIYEVQLQWNIVNDATGYLLEWGESKKSLENSVNFAADQTSYLHQGLEPETTYYYRITAEYAEEKSGKPSKRVMAKTGSETQIIQSDVAY